mmetsp:Transcript_23981/g.44054  ORF Transcript_23981/g.44054 Transcript_23981/m.44054 type:complete len:679 (+) Transcript_23981:37-2073(+)
MTSRVVVAEHRDDLSQHVQESLAGQVEVFEKRSRGSCIDGSLVARSRNAGPPITQWLVASFHKMQLRDDCLMTVIGILDRLGVAREGKAAVSNDCAWLEALAAVLIALKESEAEAELETDDGGLSVQDLVLRMKEEGRVRFQGNVGNVWDAIRKVEIHMLYRLDYRVAVPTAFSLVKELALEISQAAQGSQWPGARPQRMPTPGHKLGHAPESRPSFALLAEFLVELAVVHAPERVYRDKAPPAAVALAALSISLDAFGRAPEAAVYMLRSLVKLLLPSEEETNLLLPLRSVLVAVRSEFAEFEVCKKWKRRTTMGCTTFVDIPLPTPCTALFNAETPVKKVWQPVTPSALPIKKKMDDIDDDDVETTTPSSSCACSPFEDSEASGTPDHFPDLDDQAPCTPRCGPGNWLAQKVDMEVTPLLQALPDASQAHMPDSVEMTPESHAPPPSKHSCSAASCEQLEPVAPQTPVRKASVPSCVQEPSVPMLVLAPAAPSPVHEPLVPSIAKPSGMAVPCKQPRAMRPFGARQQRQSQDPPRDQGALAAPPPRKQGRTSAQKKVQATGAKIHNTRARTARRPALEELALKVQRGEVEVPESWNVSGTLPGGYYLCLKDPRLHWRQSYFRKREQWMDFRETALELLEKHLEEKAEEEKHAAPAKRGGGSHPPDHALPRKQSRSM